MSNEIKQHYGIDDLRYLVSRLRDAKTGCPWDIKQSYRSLANNTLEEVYEVIDAIERDDHPNLSEELGDLLFHIVFYSHIGNENGQFDFDQITSLITEKLIRRHPHVFPEGILESSRSGNTMLREDKISFVWEQIKTQERKNKGSTKTLDDIPVALPALARSLKIQKRAAQVGFDWHDIPSVLKKFNEELLELEAEIESANKEGREEEMGDLLFTCVTLARHLKVDPEKVLRGSNTKFKKRFDIMESLVENNDLSNFTADQLEYFWIRAKELERESH